MSTDATRQVVHEQHIDAPAEVVYGLIADVTNWPQIFPPTVHARCLQRDETGERIEIWATANGTPKTWRSRRQLDPQGLRIDFRQEVSQPPVAGMGGAWLVEPVSDRACRVRLLHDYRAVDDDPGHLAWIDQAVDRNSQSELAALKAGAEQGGAASEQLLSFTDAVDVDGSAEDVYDFLNDAQLWQERLPHVARVSLKEDTPGLQLLEMDTRTKDGSTHTTTSVRVCVPHERIVYKQIQVPALMTLHTGEWQIKPRPGGVRVSSRHTVRINEQNITAVLGAGADTAQARDFVRTALSGNSMATLGYAKSYAEQKR